MTEFDPENIPEGEEVDDSTPHPSPDEIGLLSIHDPDFIEQLARISHSAGSWVREAVVGAGRSL